MEDMGVLRKINGTEYVLIIPVAGLFNLEAYGMKNQPAQMWSPKMACKWTKRCELMFFELQNLAELTIECVMGAGASHLTADFQNDIELLIRKVDDAAAALVDAYLKQYDSMYLAKYRIQLANLLKGVAKAKPMAKK
jgi:hypothetical protein